MLSQHLKDLSRKSLQTAEYFLRLDALPDIKPTAKNPTAITRTFGFCFTGTVVWTGSVVVS